MPKLADPDDIIREANRERERIQSLLPEAAEFFHQYEGQMFERREAVKELSDHLEVEEDDANRLIAGLVADEVDPIVQVRAGDEKNVGIIDYEEHGFYYSYTDWDDVKEDRRINVCVRCVKEEEYDQNVYRVEGENPEEELRDHIRQEHDREPEEVETGAKLLSGTTIGGNLAFHAGNEHAENIHADLLHGFHGSHFLKNSYPSPTVSYYGTPKPALEEKFDTTSSSPQGLSVDSSGCIWHSDGGGSIYQLDRNLTVQSQFITPSSNPKGVGIDPRGGVWHADNASGCIYTAELKSPGFAQSQFAAPSHDPDGAEVDSNGCIWNADQDVDSVFKLDHKGDVKSQFAAPANSPKGLGIDQGGSIWNAASGSIYKLDQSGSIVDEFGSPSSGPRGIGIDSGGSVWHSDDVASLIYKLRASDGSVVTSFDSPSSTPRGISVDSNDCIWHSDAANAPGSIYKFDQSGNLESQFQSPSSRTRGLGVDKSNGCFWIAEATGVDKNSIYKVTRGMARQEEVSAPAANIGGLEVDKDGCVWASDTTAGSVSVYRMKPFKEVSQVTVPCDFLGVGFDEDTGSVWTVNGSGDSIFELDQNGNVQQQFSSDATLGSDVDTDSNGCIWHSDDSGDEVYQYSILLGGLSSVTTFSVSSPKGLTVDSDDCIWVASDTSGSIIKFDQTGAEQSILDGIATTNAAGGIDFDSRNCLIAWVQGSPDKFKKADRTGSVVSEFETPSTDIGGLAFDENNECIWHTYGDNNQEFHILKRLGVDCQFASPSAKPRGIGVDDVNSIWMADSSSEKLYRMERNRLIRQEADTPGSSPRGLGIDKEKGCLWHVDSANNSFHKIKPQASMFDSR